jgi:hypothetical protein
MPNIQKQEIKELFNEKLIKEVILIKGLTGQII